MTEQEKAQKELLDSIKSQVTEQIKGLTEGTIKAEDVEKKFEEITKTVNENFTSKDELKNVTEELDKVVKELEAQREIAAKQASQLDEIQKGKVNAEDGKLIFLVDAVKQAMIEQGEVVENNDFVDPLTGKKNKKINFGVNTGNKVFKFNLPEGTIIGKKVAKAAFDMTNATALDPTASINRSLDPNLVQIPNSNNVHVTSVYPSRTISTEYWEVLFQTTETDGTATKAEGDAAAQSSFKIELASYKCAILATDYRITEQALADWGEFLNEMNRLAPDRMQDLLNSKVLGSNTTIATDIVGLANSTYAQTIDFSGADAGLIPTDLGAANTIVDVIALAVGKASNANYDPDAVWMNDTDVRGLEAEKNADADSVNDRRMVFDTTGKLISIAGLKVLRNRKITKGTLLITTISENEIAFRSMVEMALGYDQSGDFSKDIITVKFRFRVVNAPRANGAHIWIDDVAQAIADLNAAS